MLHKFVVWLANTVGQSGAIAGGGVSYWLDRERRRLDWDDKLWLVREKVK